MIREKMLFRALALYLVFAMVILSLPAQVWAMFIPAAQTASSRQEDLSAIQRALESNVIKQRLVDLGLSSDEAMARVNSLSDAQIHQLASKLDSVQAGGDGADAVVFILLVAILVIVILELTGHRVIVR